MAPGTIPRASPIRKPVRTIKVSTHLRSAGDVEKDVQPILRDSADAGACHGKARGRMGFNCRCSASITTSITTPSLRKHAADASFSRRRRTVCFCSNRSATCRTGADAARKRDGHYELLERWIRPGCRARRKRSRSSSESPSKSRPSGLLATGPSQQLVVTATLLGQDNGGR